MSEISPIIQLFKEDVDTAIENNQRNDVSEPARKKLDPLREESFALVKQSFDTYKQLQGLTDGSNYDRGAISAATKNLDSSMRQLDRSLKKAISIIQKDAKSSKKA